MEKNKELSSDDLLILGRFPSSIVAWIGGADGKVNQSEQNEFRNLLASESESKILRSSLDCFLDVMKAQGTEAAMGEVVPFKQECKLTLEVLHKVNENISTQYKSDLFQYAVRIAEASGGGFLGLGNRISDIEVKALIHFAKLMEIDPSTPGFEKIKNRE